MKVNVMELLDGDSPDGKKTLLQVDDETLITVLGLGSGEYKWKVECCGKGHPENSYRVTRDTSDYDPMATVSHIPGMDHVKEDGFIPGIGSLGPALVWAEPITFAHVVMDLINNQ